VENGADDEIVAAHNDQDGKDVDGQGGGQNVGLVAPIGG